MINTLGEKLARVFDAVHRMGETKASEKAKERVVLDALEIVVDGTDPTIRLVSGYKRKLWPAIERSLQYTEQLVEAIPRAIDVGSGSFVSDQYLNAFFANPRDMEATFRQSSELMDFLENEANCNARESWALLCMRKAEKTVLGMDLSGDLIRRDVKQTAVSFFDHRLQSPAATESEAREELKFCFFEGLINNAFSRIVELRTKKGQLETGRQMLQARLRQRRSISGTEATTGDNEGERQGKEALEAQLAENEEQLRALGLITPQVCLDHVAGVFQHPENYVKLKKISMNLDKMGIKISGDSSKPSNRLELAEVELAEHTRRIVVLTRLKQDELQLCKPFPYRPMMH